jgi:hypothetical protein
MEEANNYYENYYKFINKPDQVPELKEKLFNLLSNPLYNFE